MLDCYYIYKDTFKVSYHKSFIEIVNELKSAPFCCLACKIVVHLLQKLKKNY